MEISVLHTGISDFWLSSRNHLIESVSFEGRPGKEEDKEAGSGVDFFEKQRENPLGLNNGRLKGEEESQTVSRLDEQDDLSEEEMKEVEELKKRDLEVKRHEQAHFHAAGRYASPPVYEYQTGPDGKRYAVGGKVPIDTSEIPGDPEATLQKARIVKRAALAPEEPSAQDQRVARKADKMAIEAQREISESRGEQVTNQGKSDAAEHNVAMDSQVPEAGSQDQELRVSSDFSGTNVHRYQVSHLDIANLMFGEKTIQTVLSPYQSQSPVGQLGNGVNIFA